MTLHLVRHGRPLVDRTRRAADWPLDPAAYDDIRSLRESGRLPARAVWFSSPEPKALGTAELLHDGQIAVVAGLREHVRGSVEWLNDFDDAVRRAFAVPEAVAVPGWEPIATCRERVVGTVASILGEHGDTDVVLVGHGTALTVLVAELTGREPDLDRLRDLAMPDLITVND